MNVRGLFWWDVGFLAVAGFVAYIANSMAGNFAGFASFLVTYAYLRADMNEEMRAKAILKALEENHCKVMARLQGQGRS